MMSLVLIRHDNIKLIEKDPDFGKKLARACCTSRCGSKDIDFGLSGAMVVGQYFSTSDTKILIAEGGTAWVADWKGKPDWSKLTKSYAMNVIFGEQKPKEKKK